jgi:hypothetical protein
MWHSQNKGQLEAALSYMIRERQGSKMALPFFIEYKQL